MVIVLYSYDTFRIFYNNEARIKKLETHDRSLMNENSEKADLSTFS